MRKFILSGIMITVSFTAMAQSLEKMQWFNEPEQWEIEDNSLSMYVTPAGAVENRGQLALDVCHPAD